MSWHTTSFEKLYAEPSRNGIYKSKKFHGSGVRIVNMGEMFRFSFLEDQPMKRLQITDDEMHKFELLEGDLIFARRSLVESGAGKCSLVTNHSDPMVFESSMIRVRLRQDICLPKFYYYYFKSSIGRKSISAIVTGVAQKGIRGSELQTIQVHCPPLLAQKNIVSILSNYDDLIDNNNRRIALLEESVHRLYREWFVHLRFPGHERVAVVDGVPKGWEKKLVQDSFETLGGGTPSKKKNEYWQDGNITWYSPTDLTRLGHFFMEDSASKITQLGLSKSSAKLFPPFCVMLTSRATIGVIAINTTKASTNQGFITCIPNEKVPVYFLNSWLKENVDVFINLASGATFKEISKGVFRKIEIVLPTEDLIQSFETQAQTLGKQMLNSQRQNSYLREARDRLLPRLMNGSISI